VRRSFQRQRRRRRRLPRVFSARRSKRHYPFTARNHSSHSAFIVFAVVYSRVVSEPPPINRRSPRVSPSRDRDEAILLHSSPPPSPSTTPSHLPVERGVNAQRCARIRHLLPRNQQCRNVCQRKLAGRGEIRVALFVPVLRPARRQFSRAKLSRNVTPPGEKRTMGGKREIFLGELPRNGGALPFATDETLSSDGPPNGGPNSWVFISACNIHGLIPQISGLLPKPSLRLE